MKGREPMVHDKRVARFNLSAAQQARGWQEEARRAAQTADYWQKRHDQAEQQAAVYRVLLARWLERYGAQNEWPGEGFALVEETRAVLKEQTNGA